MIVGIQDVYYNVSDMARAVAFYTDVLGCEVRFGDEYWTSLSAHGINLGLHGTNGRAVPEVPQDEHGANAGGTLTFKSDNFTADKEKLISHGVIIVGEVNADFGNVLIFKDPDGNILKLMQPNY